MPDCAFTGIDISNNPGLIELYEKGERSEEWISENDGEKRWYVTYRIVRDDGSRDSLTVSRGTEIITGGGSTPETVPVLKLSAKANDVDMFYGASEIRDGDVIHIGGDAGHFYVVLHRYDDGRLLTAEGNVLINDSLQVRVSDSFYSIGDPGHGRPFEHGWHNPNNEEFVY